jgi:hypothetical protein
MANRKAAMTDEKIDLLARKILTQVIADVNEMDSLREVLETEASELTIVVSGTSDDGYGSFRCEYMPLDAIKKIIVECEAIYDAFLVTVADKQTGKSVEKTLIEFAPENRDTSISFMAELATLHLVGTFFYRVGEVLVEDVKDSELLANGVLAQVVAHVFIEQGLVHPVADARSDIDKAAERVANTKRVMLRHHFGALPNVVAERGRGGAYNVKHDWTPQELDCLAKNYAELRPVWLDAKQIARTAQKSKVSSRKRNWRDEVLRAYPDLPIELLDRFAHLRADDAKPSDIAIIHAKIKCGVKETYSARELRDKIKSRNLKTETRTSTKSSKPQKLKS